jgi:hypothetical protein
MSEMTDSEFEALVARARVVRFVRAEAIAHERQLHTATDGLSLQFAIDRSPEGRQRALIATLASIGMTAREIDSHLRSLRSGA